MSIQRWSEVDRYVDGLFAPMDAALQSTLRRSVEAGLPAIQVSANQGKLLAILAQSVQARSILEIGSLGGYSTIWMARALPVGGKLITLEIDPKHAAVTQANLKTAGVADLVELRLGPALETLPKLFAEGCGPFDLFFIDADKPNMCAYFEWALKMSHPGSLILVDNVVRDGAVVDASSTDASVQGARKFNAALAQEKRVSATVVQTVGAKGYDGFAMALVTGG